MRALLLVVLLGLANPILAEQIYKAVSSPYRVAMLELYTSEGCSSCPPADRFISKLKDSELSDQRLVPLAFHVTYWDYIGWRDPFANAQYDDRQHKQALLNASKIVYTPQFMMNGKDFRRYRHLHTDITRINAQPAPVSLEIAARPGQDGLAVNVNVERMHGFDGDTIVYIALYEHNLSSAVTAGENEGEQLRHDYVVRKLAGPFHARQFPYAVSSELLIENNWNLENMGVVVFAQKPMSSEVLQAVNLNMR
jgi:hypothetical protein